MVLLGVVLLLLTLGAAAGRPPGLQRLAMARSSTRPAVPRAVPVSGRLVAAAAFALPPLMLLGRRVRIRASRWRSRAGAVAAGRDRSRSVALRPRGGGRGSASAAARPCPSLPPSPRSFVWSAASMTWTASREATFEHVLRVAMLAGAAVVGLVYGARPRAALSLAAGLAIFGAVAAGMVEAKLLAGEADAFVGSRLSWPINYAPADAALVWLPLPALAGIRGSAAAAARGHEGLRVRRRALARRRTHHSEPWRRHRSRRSAARHRRHRKRPRPAQSDAAGGRRPVAALLRGWSEAMRRRPPTSCASADRPLSSPQSWPALSCASSRCSIAGADSRSEAGKPGWRWGLGAGPRARRPAFAATSGRPDEWASARWDEFTNVGSTASALAADATHFGTGVSNRYDYWRVAWRAFEADPVQGVGAGAFSVPWFRSRSIDENVTDAHSWQAAALAETGLVGLGADRLRARVPARPTPKRARQLGSVADRRSRVRRRRNVFRSARLARLAVPDTGDRNPWFRRSRRACDRRRRTAGRADLRPPRPSERLWRSASIVAVVLATSAYLSTAAVAPGQTEAATSTRAALAELEDASRLNPFATDPLLVRSLDPAAR